MRVSEQWVRTGGGRGKRREEEEREEVPGFMLENVT